MSDRCYGLAGGVAIVTGAGRGIGRAIALGLAAEGVAVAFNGRTPETIEQVAQEIRASGGCALAVPGRVERRADVLEMTHAVMEEFGQIDFLVNNAGVSRPGHFVELSEEDWKAQIDINLTGAFLCSQAAARHMVGRGGAIVNVCSIASLGGQEGRAGYAASKAGLFGLTRVMAQELSPLSVRVNAVAPSIAATEITAHVPQAFLRDVVIDRTPLGRMAEPHEIADTVLFLLSAGASYVTGQILAVDGGLLSGYFYSKQAEGASFARVTPPSDGDASWRSR